MAGPIILANVSVPLLGAVDTAVVGHLPEPYYIGAVAIGIGGVIDPAQVALALAPNVARRHAQRVASQRADQQSAFEDDEPLATTESFLQGSVLRVWFPAAIRKRMPTALSYRRPFDRNITVKFTMVNGLK